MAVVGALKAWAETTGSSDVTVGIVDTGLYLDHPDLADQLAINEAEDINNNGRFDPYPASEGGDLNGVDDDGNGYVDDVVGYDFVDRPRAIASGDYEDRDPDPRPDSSGPGSGHGTAVAGVVAASPQNPDAGVAGVAPGVSILPLRAFGGDGRGQADDIAAAIVYGATQGVDVLNLSFGRDQPVPVIEEAIEYANEQGTVVVAAAGNELTDNPHYPSDYPEVVSVAWLAEDGEGLPEFNRSQYGIGVDIGAPGTNVFSTRFPRNHLSTEDPPPRSALYGPNTGSSFSAPQVAGAAALLRSADSSLSPASIRSILTSTAEDLEAEDWDVRTGAGRLNARTALLRSYPARTEITRPRHNSGTQGDAPLPIIGSALSASFESYTLSYAEGTRNLDARPDPWQEIQDPVTSQRLRDTLGVWDVRSLPEGQYTLRLVTRLTDGSTVEDRRRVYVDRTPPTVDVRFLGPGRVEGEGGIVADVESDDPVRLHMDVRLNGRRDSVRSEARGRRQGLSWIDEHGRGGTANITLTATNPSGLTTTVDTSLSVPSDQENEALLRRTMTSVPRGYLLSTSTDFDDDGLRELVLNQDRPTGGLSDTLRSFEWTGDGFAPADTLQARAFPRDLGDSDGNGRQELLLQVRGETTLLEQTADTTFPSRTIFSDSTVSEDDTFRGALLADLTGDGRDDLLGATDSTEWRVLARHDDEFREAFRLSNPTGTAGRDSVSANTFGPPTAASADFDGDGAPDLLVGDRDGDLIVYEAQGNGTMEVAWTHETARVDAGERFGVGDATGDGQPEFVTMSRTAPEEFPGGGRAPSISYYSVWTARGPDAYERSYRLPIAEPAVDRGAIETGDLDGDDRDEVVIAHPPSLLVLDWTDGAWRVLHENHSSPSILTSELVVSDLSGDGRASVVAAANDEVLRRYVVDGTAVRNGPPRWTGARPLGPTSTRLSWRAPATDSVEIFAGPPEGAVDPLRTTTDSVAVIAGEQPRRFALRAWRDGEASPLAPGRTVRPHAPATVTAVEYPDPSTVELRFSEPLAEATRAEHFSFGPDQESPTRLVQTHNRTALVLGFSESVTGQDGRLRWRGVTDSSGLAVKDTARSLTFPASTKQSLFVEEATILDERRVQLRYSEAVPTAQATDPARYRLEPHGRIDDVRMREESDRTVLLQVDGLVVGATGQEASLTVADMSSESGQSLAPEGRTVRLTRPAGDLENVFVYPNPHRRQRHGRELTIAGLPSRATIRIYTPDGRLVDEWTVEDNRTGGTTWDLRDRRRQRVPSGIYLIRVEAPEQSAVLKKAAILR